MRSKIQIDGMLLASFLTTIFYSSTYPYIHVAVISELPDTYLAVNQIVNCLSIIIFGKLWNTYSKKLFRWYLLFCICECLTTIGVVLFYVITRNIIGYYILDTLAFAIITRNIICGGVKLRALRYNTEESRERFDNNNNSDYALATIIGSIIAIWLDLNIVLVLSLAAVGNMIDNAFYICIYYSTKRRKAGDKSDNI